MGQRRVSHRLASTMISPSRFGGLALVTLLTQVGLPRAASGQIGLTASRSSMLYAAQANPDCSMLSKTDDAALPFYVARLRVVGAPAGGSVRYHWSMKKSDKGLLAADLDLGTGGQSSAPAAVSGMCADFGSACILTGQKLDFYNENHILWVAPTCDVLPKDTSKQFHGGVSHVRVKVTDGRRKVGQATAKLDWGKNGSVTLFIQDMERPPRFEDGIGRHDPIPVFANPLFAFRITSPNPGPPGSMTMQIGGGTLAAPTACPGFDGCGEVDFPSAGRIILTLTLIFEDGSALCDNILVRVATCSAKGRLEVIPKPKLAVYDPSNPSRSTVDLTVRLRNISQPEGGLPACNFLLRGADVLTCSAAIQVGSAKDTATTSFDLRHCSVTTDQGCDTDAECSCDRCKPGEICLTQPHCSQTFTKQCGNNEDCRNTGSSPPCPACKENESCVRVLQSTGTDIFVTPGKSVDLLHEPVTLRNELSSTAKITDTWTANVLIPGISASKKLKYGIRSRR
jgi:hypothetical protein